MSLVKGSTIHFFIAVGAYFLGSPLPAQVHWTRVGNGPVLSPGEPGSWESYAQANPAVLADEAGLKMWYAAASRFPYDEQMGLATSTDGVVWEKSALNPVFPGFPGTWQARVATCTVIQEAPGAYAAWYMGLWQDGHSGALGRATSDDGATWERGADPVLTPDAASWEGQHIAHPAVHFDGSTYHLWYHAGTGNPSLGIGYATSQDGVVWKKYAGNPVLTATPDNPGGVYNPSVVFDPGTGTYEMWYTRSGFSDIGYATSGDGMAWNQYDGNPVLSQGSGWDSGMAINPSVLCDGKTYRMWYFGGEQEAGGSIGLASADWTIPRASFTAAPHSDAMSVTVDVDGSRTTTPHASITDYRWDFGDGSDAVGSGSSPFASHQYACPGRYVVKVTATDDTGAQGAVTRLVEVSLTGCELTSPWSSEDIGEPLYAGNACGTASEVTVAAGGRPLGGSSDQFQFIHQSVTGDASITTHIKEAGCADTWQVGVMFREDLDPRSRHVSMLLYAQDSDHAARFRSAGRAKPRGTTSLKDGVEAVVPAAWVRIERRGDEFTTLTSVDGVKWEEVQKITLADCPEALLAGIASVGRDTSPGTGVEALLATVCEIEVGPLVPPGVGPFRRGDADASGEADITDAVVLLGYLFLGSTEPGCLEAADTNDSGRLDISDGVFLLSFLFLGEAAPPAPGPFTCGLDTTPSPDLTKPCVYAKCP